MLDGDERRTDEMTARIFVNGVILIIGVMLLAPDIIGLEPVVPFAMIGALRPAVTIAVLMLAILALTRRRWRPMAAAMLGLALLSTAFVLHSRAFPTSPPEAGSRTSLSILSFNVYAGAADEFAVARVIASARPDLVVLPEAGHSYQQRLLAALRPIRYASWTTGRPDDLDVHGIVVLAAPRLGRLESRVLDQGARFQWLELTGGGLDRLSVVAVHAAAPMPDVLPKWEQDLANLRRWCQVQQGAVALIGDFNATLDHRGMRSMGCTDVAGEVGRGLTATWPTYLPRWLGVQIDHVLVSPGVVPISAQVLDLPGSDHRALLARISLPPEPAPSTR